MAISYSTLATKIGKIIAKSNSYASLATTTLPADLQAIAAAYGTAATTFGVAGTPIEGIISDYVNFGNYVVGIRLALDPYIQRTLLDQDTILSQLVGLTSQDFVTVMLAIYRDMIINSQTVKGDTITIGSVSAVSGNVGNGTAYFSAVLDGYNAPRIGAPVNQSYNGVTSNLVVPSETMELACDVDSGSGGVSEGSEIWTWTGGQRFGLFDWHSEGSGPGPGLITANSETLFSNLDFETWSSNAPGSWTIDAGAAGTSIFQETSVIFRGTSSLKFLGTGAVQPSLSQALSASSVQARRRYLLTAQLRKGGSAATGGEKVNIKFTGTGYTAASSEKISVTITSLTTSFAAYNFYINMPNAIPSDFKLNVGVDTANQTSGNILYVDSMSFKAVDYHGGVSGQVIAGSTPWVRGDRLRCAISSNAAGNFQEYFRKAYNFQLPYVLDGSESINDALAS